MEDISALQNANRVEIFKHIALTEMNDIDLEILDNISCNLYDSFMEFCDKVFQNKDNISNINIKDGEFNIIFK